MSFLNNILNGDLIDFLNFILDGDKTNSDLEHTNHKKHHKHKKRHTKHKKHRHHKEHTEDTCDDEPIVCEITSNRQNKDIMKKLHEVTRQIQHKISSDIQNNLEDYFILTGPSGTTEAFLTPKLIQIKLDDTGRFIEVPKFTLVNHSNVDLKQLNCVFKTDAKSLGITCKENFDIETNAVFEQNATSDGYNKLNELLISEYIHPIRQDPP
jgi:hypothetical protein